MAVMSVHSKSPSRGRVSEQGGKKRLRSMSTDRNADPDTTLGALSRPQNPSFSEQDRKISSLDLVHYLLFETADDHQSHI
ncbi:hypothetical protein ACHAP5_010687 [Fusarium lateritium]